MTYTSSPVHCRMGFTLLEIIVTLVVISITAAIMFPVMGDKLIKSPEPIKRVNSQYQLVEEMDKITGKYREEIAKGTLDINGFKSTTVDVSPYVDAANTYFITSFTDDGTTYSPVSNSILMVTLRSDEQALCSLFVE